MATGADGDGDAVAVGVTIKSAHGIIPSFGSVPGGTHEWPYQETGLHRGERAGCGIWGVMGVSRCTK